MGGSIPPLLSNTKLNTMKKVLLLIMLYTAASCTLPEDLITEFGETILPENTVHNYILDDMVDDWLQLAKDNGYNYDYILQSHRTYSVKFTDLPSSVRGRSWAIRNDKKVIIHIDREKWISSEWLPVYNRKILYHELAHDVLRHKHNDADEVAIMRSSSHPKHELIDTMEKLNEIAIQSMKESTIPKTGITGKNANNTTDDIVECFESDF